MEVMAVIVGVLGYLAVMFPIPALLIAAGIWIYRQMQPPPPPPPPTRPRVVTLVSNSPSRRRPPTRRPRRTQPHIDL